MATDSMGRDESESQLELINTSGQRSDWPELLYMTSTGLPATSEPGNGEARRPKGDEVGAVPLRLAFR
jgi:hypothetical protein